MKVVMVVVLAVAVSAAAKPAEANPWIVMGAIKLADYLIQKETRQTRSDVGSLSVANLLLDGRVVAGTPTAGLAELVVPRVEGHDVVLLVDTQADIVPSVCSEFTEIQVRCNGAPDFTITQQMAARAAGWSPDLSVRGGDQSWKEAEKDWVVPIDVNKLAFGQYLFRLDYYFKNGGRRDSFAVFIHLFVTDLQTLQDGVNSPVIQQVLRLTGGIWTPIPVMGTTDIPISAEMARENGMEAAAEAAGIPRDGTVTRTTREIGRVQYVTPPGTPPAPAPSGAALEKVRGVVGFAGGNPGISCPFRPSRPLGFVPVVVVLRSPDQQVTINGQAHQPYMPGFVVARARPGMDLGIDIDGNPFFRGIAPPEGMGLWLVE